MAINFVMANSTEGLQNALSTGEIKKEDIAFVAEGGKEALHTNNKTFNFVPSGGIPGQVLNVNDTGRLSWKNSDDSNIGVNKVSSVASIPVNKRLVIATVSASGSFSLARTPIDGKDIHVIINNSSSSDIIITLPNTGIYKSAIGTELKIKGKSYGEINAISDGRTVYLRGI